MAQIMLLGDDELQARRKDVERLRGLGRHSISLTVIAFRGLPVKPVAILLALAVPVATLTGSDQPLPSPVTVFVTSTAQADSTEPRAHDASTAKLIQQVKDMIRKKQKDTIAIVDDRSMAVLIVALNPPTSEVLETGTTTTSFNRYSNSVTTGKDTTKFSAVSGLVFVANDARAEPQYVGASYQPSLNDALQKTVDGIATIANRFVTSKSQPLPVDRPSSSPIRLFIALATLPGGFVDPSSSVSQSIEAIKKLIAARSPAILELTDDIATADLVLTTKAPQSTGSDGVLGGMSAALTMPKTAEFTLDVSGGCYRDVDRGCPSGVRRIVDRTEEFVAANAPKLIETRPK